jgi:1,4-alpha-glucan branching enzyme
MTRKTIAIVLFAAAVAAAQQPARPPQFQSPEVSADRKVTFRIHAPGAEAITLVGSDIPNNGKGTPMIKGTEGVWEATLGGSAQPQHQRIEQQRLERGRGAGLGRL